VMQFEFPRGNDMFCLSEQRFRDRLPYRGYRTNRIKCLRKVSDVVYIPRYQPRLLRGGPLVTGNGDFQMTCRICNKPLELGTDTAADEDGKAVHKSCYTKQITNALHNPPATPSAD
jgi:hypothetical protein